VILVIDLPGTGLEFSGPVSLVVRERFWGACDGLGICIQPGLSSVQKCVKSPGEILKQK
jgi:hypothetical protein